MTDLDRLAKAAFEAWKADFPEIGTLEPDRNWGDRPEDVSHFRSKVRTILTELMEMPQRESALYRAGQQSGYFDSRYEDYGDATARAFVAMIDSILKEP